MPLSGLVATPRPWATRMEVGMRSVRLRLRIGLSAGLLMAAVAGLVMLWPRGAGWRDGTGAALTGGTAGGQRPPLRANAAFRVPVPQSGAAATGPGLRAFERTPLAFELNQGQTDPQVKFLARGPGYAMFLTGNEAVLRLGGPVGARRAVPLPARGFPGPLWSGSDPFGARRRSETAATAGFFRLVPLLPAALQDGVLSEWEDRESEIANQQSSVVSLRLVGANPKPEIIGLEPLRAKSNYFIGNDPKRWRTNVPNFAKVMYKDVYPGIDVVFYGKNGELEHDFVVHPGADPKAIRFAVAAVSDRRSAVGTPPLQVDAQGDLVIGTEAGEVRLRKPVVYQMPTSVNSSQLSVDSSPAAVGAPESRQAALLTARRSSLTTPHFLDARYVVHGLTLENPQSEIANLKYQVSFALPPYDPKQTLVIDPTLNYLATFGGSSGTDSDGIALDGAGNAYVTGITSAGDFPSTPGAFQTTLAGGEDAIVRKFDSTGAVVYSTYLGGSGNDEARGIAIDSSGNAYIAGLTNSTDFPTLGAFQPANAGGYYGDAFVTELNATGSGLVYSSYLGGSSDDLGFGISVDSAGNAYVTGQTLSSDFPTVNAFQPHIGGGTGCVPGALFPCGDAFVTKIAAGGSGLVYSTYLGGSNADGAAAIAVDSAGNVYLTGLTYSFDFPALNPFQAACVPTAGVGTCTDAFVAELNATGSALVFSTYLGGSGYDVGRGIALDSSGNIYVAGQTGSTDFPTLKPYQASNAGGISDAFVTELAAGGGSLVYSTYLGGSDGDWALSVSVDPLGEAFVTGGTDSSDFPLASAIQSTYGGNQDVIVTGFQAGGTGLIYSTYLGGTGSEEGQGISVDAAGNAWVTGSGDSTSFLASIARTRRDSAAPAQQTSGVTQAVAANIALDLPRVSLSSPSLAFGYELVGGTSAPERVTVKNTGTAALAFTSITASAGFATVSSGTTCSTSGSVMPGASCTINVALAPKAEGTVTGTLTLTDNGIGSPHVVKLTGTGATSSPVVLPEELDFGAQPLGTTSAPQVVTLANALNQPLVMRRILALPRHRYAETNNCGVALAPNASCTLRVTFTPRVAGSRKGLLILIDRGGTTRHQLVRLTGTGAAPSGTP